MPLWLDSACRVCSCTNCRGSNCCSVKVIVRKDAEIVACPVHCFLFLRSDSETGKGNGQSPYKLLQILIVGLAEAVTVAQCSTLSLRFLQRSFRIPCAAESDTLSFAGFFRSFVQECSAALALLLLNNATTRCSCVSAPVRKLLCH